MPSFKDLFRVAREQRIARMMHAGVSEEEAEQRVDDTPEQTDEMATEAAGQMIDAAEGLV